VSAPVQLLREPRDVFPHLGLRLPGERAHLRDREALFRHVAGVYARESLRSGITTDTIYRMAMTLRLTDEETEALRLRAEREGRSMQEVARAAVRDYVDRTSTRELLDEVLDAELPRFAEALRRLGE